MLTFERLPRNATCTELHFNGIAFSFFSARKAHRPCRRSVSASSRRALDSRSDDALTSIAWTRHRALQLRSLVLFLSRARGPMHRRDAVQRLRNVWNAAALRMRAASLTRNRRTAGSVMSLDDDLTIVCGDLTETCGPLLCLSLSFSLSLFLPRRHLSS